MPDRPPPQAPGPGLRIARPFGIPVYISPYWFAIAGLFVILYANNAAITGTGNLRYLVAVAIVVLLYGSVLVHPRPARRCPWRWRRWDTRWSPPFIPAAWLAC
jgi:hypothetical protein